MKKMKKLILALFCVTLLASACCMFKSSCPKKDSKCQNMTSCCCDKNSKCECKCCCNKDGTCTCKCCQNKADCKDCPNTCKCNDCVKCTLAPADKSVQPNQTSPAATTPITAQGSNK